MSATDGSVPPPPTVPGRADPSALLEAMENAPAAIYCLAAASPQPVWANARARSMGTGRGDLPVLDGRPVADLVDTALRTGRAETVWGRTSADAAPTTVVLRPMQVAGGPGVLLVLEEDGDRAGTAQWPEALAGVVEQVQHA